jgi:hypothetical protein
MSMSGFDLFKVQQKLLCEELKKSDVWFPPLRGEPKKDNSGNWFFCFVPESWGRWKGASYGVHFDFIYARGNDDQPERFRLVIGVEAPLNEQHRQSFKEEVISRTNAKGIKQFGFTLKAENRKKLLEAEPIPCGPDSWRIALEKYFALHPVVDVVAQVIREYSDRGAFNPPIEFR